jgi:hypothetical protein
MRSITLSNTELDLLAQKVPVGTTGVLNAANGIIIEGTNTSGSGYATIVTLTTAAPFQTANIPYRYIRVSTAAPGTLFVD